VAAGLAIAQAQGNDFALAQVNLLNANVRVVIRAWLRLNRDKQCISRRQTIK